MICEEVLYKAFVILWELFKSEELLGLQLLTAHNMYFMNFLMKTIRDAIKVDKLLDAELSWYN